MIKPPEQIETERLLLRKPRMEDAADVFDGWARRPEVTRFLTWRPHESVKQTEELMKRSIAAWDGETNFRYLLEIQESGALAGMIELRLEREPFKVSFGYTGAYAQWGKGYMTEATRACIQWAFEQPGVYRVAASKRPVSSAAVSKIDLVPSCQGVLSSTRKRPSSHSVTRRPAMVGRHRYLTNR